MRKSKTAEQAIVELRAYTVPANREGMARFGIDVSRAIGVSMPNIRKVGMSTVRNHGLAGELWSSGLQEESILASLVEEPDKVTLSQMNNWASDFNSWDLFDQVCGNLFDRLEYTESAIEAWRNDEREFVRRAAFALIAWRAVHLKKEPDKTFLNYLPMIEDAATDNRNFVKKAVNWALRQIGKRNANLRVPSLQLARKLSLGSNKASVWIGKKAAKELESKAVLAKLHIK
jgi:3-methyladenine DNA glycosylase AlkD